MTTYSVKGKGFRQLLNAAGDAMLVVDARGDVVAMNPEAEQLLGWTEAELLGQPLDRVVPQRFSQSTESHRAHEGGSPETPRKGVSVNLSAQRRDGTEFPIDFNRSSLGPGKDALAVITIRDITKLRDAQEMLFREKEQASVTLASIADAIITTDLAGAVTYLNPTAERLSGWRMTEALGQPLGTVLVLVSESTRQPIEDIAARCLREGRALDLVNGVLLLRRDGTELAIGDSAAPLRDRNGSTTGVVVVFRDVTERRRAVHTLSHEAKHDALTGLIGKREFERRLARVLAETEPGTSEHALCFLDLDRFKLVNDVCGHEAGDSLLRTIGKLLAGRLRSRDTVARLGGDEFGVLLEHCSLAKAEEISGNLLRTIEDFHYVWKDKSFSLGASIGVVPITGPGGRVADFLNAADEACYAAKDAGGNRVHLGPEPARGVMQQVETRRIVRLTRAVEEGHFQLFAQQIVPLVSPHADRPRCEILLRLPDDHGGTETSESLLQHAERYRLRPAIDRWVVRQTVALLGAWHRDHPEHDLPLCSINLSLSSLGDLDLISTLRASLREHELPPEGLSFEIAEAAALGNFAQLARLVSEIRAVGCGVGLDDFGGGLASFTHLKALPIDYVKIGGLYVRRVVEDPVYGTLVSAINEVGRIMGITTIAEDVEDRALLPKLQELGVGFAQGEAVAPATRMTNADGKVVFPGVRLADR